MLIGKSAQHGTCSYGPQEYFHITFHISIYTSLSGEGVYLFADDCTCFITRSQLPPHIFSISVLL